MDLPWDNLPAEFSSVVEVVQCAIDVQQVLKARPKITKIEVHCFECQLKDVAPERTISIPIYKPGVAVSPRIHASKYLRDLAWGWNTIGTT